MWPIIQIDFFSKNRVDYSIIRSIRFQTKYGLVVTGRVGCELFKLLELRPWKKTTG